MTTKLFSECGKMRFQEISSPEKWFPVKKSPKKRFLLKELPENLPKEVEQFLNFYRSIPPDDPTYTKKY